METRLRRRGLAGLESYYCFAANIALALGAGHEDIALNQTLAVLFSEIGDCSGQGQGAVVGHRLSKDQVQVLDGAGAAPVGQKLGHHRHSHDAGHNRPAFHT